MVSVIPKLDDSEDFVMPKTKKKDHAMNPAHSTDGNKQSRNRPKDVLLETPSDQ